MSRPDDSHESHHQPHQRPGDDVGAELLAHVLGELEPERARELERRLTASPELRARRETLAADIARLGPATVLPAPSRGPLDRVLAEIEDEAGERRAAHAVKRSPLPVEIGETIVAHALGQLTGTSANEAERIVAQTPAAADEVAVVGRLVAATRHAYSVVPSEGAREDIVRAFREGRPAMATTGLHDVPAPESRPHPGGHLRQMLLPALVAAAALVLFSLLPLGGTPSHVTVGQIFRYPHLSEQSEVVDADNGGFEFEVGDVLEAGRGPSTVHVACRSGVDLAATGTPAAGTAAFTLQPGARLRRDGDASFSLLLGRVEIEAVELADTLEVLAGDLYASVRGTHFDLLRDETRLVAIVHEGSVEIGRRGDDPDAIVLGAGEQGLVDATRLLRHAISSLAPRALLVHDGRAVPAGEPVTLTASLEAGEGGAVTIAAFDPSQPLFLVRLTGPDGRMTEVKLQESMLGARAPTPAADGTWALAPGSPYGLVIALPTDGLEPGAWEARLRYMSYRANAGGGEWLGVVESPAVRFEVNSE